MKGTGICLVFALALLLGVPSSRCQTSPAQNPQSPASAPASAEPTAVLRTTTRLVQLNVIVQDKRGQPVRGLNKEDFTILDNGKPQTIAFFSNESGSPQPSAELASVRSLPSNVFGNRIHRESDLPGSVTVILFDALNTSFKDQSYAKSQVLKFLQQLQPQDHVAIYLLTKQLTVINEFTQDSKSLLTAIERFQADPSTLLKAANPEYLVAADTGAHDAKAAQHLAALMNLSSSNLSDLANLDRVQITAQALTAIANHVAGIPGRKNLVWVSGGFPMAISLTSSQDSPVDSQSQNFAPLVHNALRAVNQANLAIYPVDARGLFVPESTDASIAHSFGPYSPPTDLAAGQDEQSTMNIIATQTGGHAFFNSNDIKGAIRRTIADSNSNYLVGFYPDHGNWNGQYHEIKLNVKGSPLVLRYRKGYFALANSTDTSADARSALLSALWSPVDATSLGVMAKIQSVDSNSRKLDLRVKLDASELQLNDVDSHHTGRVDAIYLQLGPGDAILAASPLSYNLQFYEREYESILKRGYELQESLAILPSTRALRIVVRDGASGAIGSVTIPLVQFLPPHSESN